eukprot:TRINITY_DN3344_c0_g4_i1.p2 TRINITY_DN3344_c0_g4~~TRINITY_DN3344_c0_g4_i1.p2  ORF type:complete len:123 (+),score=12.75 TRINITY_DN3344_c0_g4_i1:1637-2005(+)
MDEIPSENCVEDVRVIPETPGFNSIPKAEMEAVRGSIKKSHTIPDFQVELQKFNTSVQLEDKKELAGNASMSMNNNASNLRENAASNTQRLQVPRGDRQKRPTTQSKSQLNFPTPISHNEHK